MTISVPDAKMIDEKTRRKETASSEPHQWVRLTSACNNNCIFCLDSETQNSSNVPASAIMAEIRAGRENGATRLILSGGEATLHPDYIEILRFASTLGYRRIQTVSNGRMFAYTDFLEKAVGAGLQEITFSMHGDTPGLHDAQTRVPGSFAQALAGLINARSDPRLIVNVDIVINQFNYRHIRRIMDFFIRLGIHEFDLLHVTPFGEAWANRESVFYDPAEGVTHLASAFELADRPDLYVWTNRFPASYLTAFHRLIQNPLKIKDEVRGRAEMFDHFIRTGTHLPCRGDRCRFCFIAGFCNYLERAVNELSTCSFASLAIGPAASCETMPHLISNARSVLFSSLPYSAAGLYDAIQPGAALTIITGSPQEAAAAIPRSLADHVTIHSTAPLPSISEWPANIRLRIELNKATATFIRNHAAWIIAAGAGIYAPNRYTLEDVIENDIAPAEFFRSFDSHGIECLNLPPCVTGAHPVYPHAPIDAAAFTTAPPPDLQTLASSYILHAYYVKPPSCADCVHDPRCQGLHINQLRAFGFAHKPVTRGSSS